MMKATGFVPRKHVTLSTVSMFAFGMSSAHAEAARAASDNLEEVVVLGRAQELYRIETTSAGTKTPTDIMSVPQSIQLLPQQLIEDQAARQITDLYRSISGVTQYSYSGVTFRGFRQDEVRYDGVAGDPFSEFSVPQLFNIERIEVLKGPSGMLYGAANPGGLINYVTKKPTVQQQGKLTVFGGDYDLRGASGEYSGAVNASETLRVRVGAFDQTKKPFRFNTQEDNTIIDVGLEYAPSERTSFIAQVTYVDQLFSGARLRGVPVDNDGNFLADIRWNAAEPTDYQDVEGYVYQGIARHDFNNGFTSTFTGRYITNERTQKYHEPRGVVDTNADGRPDAMNRQVRDQFRSNDEYSFTLDNVYQADWAGIGHTLLFGGDFFEQTALQLQRAAGASRLSLENPVYGTSVVPALPVLFHFDDRITRRGVYLQDQLKFSEHFEAIGGARFDSFEARDLTGVVDDSSDEAVTLRGGLIYKPTEGISTYASYAQGFKPQNPANQESSAGPFDPEESEQFEVGVKTNLFGGRIQASAALYQITKRNLLQPDPDPAAAPDSLVAFGKVRSRGGELDFISDLTQQWVLMVNYAYNDTRIMDGAGTPVEDAFGDRFANAPKNTVGVWTRHELPFLEASIAGGMEYISERVNFNGQRVPSYTIFDLSVQAHWRQLDFQINARNILDKRYQSSGFTARGGNFPGEPRNVVAQVKWNFL